MESLENTRGIGGFFKHVFNFDDASKADILNILQYGLIAVIPVVIVNKLMQNYVPQADENKGNIEITLEVILQLSLMLLGILFIHRIIEYIPTYSGVPYPEFKVVYVIIAVAMITMSLQTKLGEKISILSDRVIDLWNGTSENDKNKKKKQQKTKPVNQQQIVQQIPPNPISPNQEAINQSMMGGGGGSYGSTDIGSLPSSGTGQIADYSNMYQNTTNPLQNASIPGGGIEQFTPMAANEAGGGLFGSSLF